MIPYPKLELSEDEWDRILGKYIETEVPIKDIPTLWAKLRDLEPIDSRYGTHVINSVFLLNGIRYNCYWALDDYNTVSSISIQTPRSKIVKYPTIQLELFCEETHDNK